MKKSKLKLKLDREFQESSFKELVLFMVIAVSIEELMFRLIISIVVINTISLTGFANQWFVPIFISSSSILSSLMHQTNIREANLLGRLSYFTMQICIAFCFAIIYIQYGFGGSWLVHFLFDFTLITSACYIRKRENYTIRS